jgi:hypothetical protein
LGELSEIRKDKHEWKFNECEIGFHVKNLGRAVLGCPIYQVKHQEMFAINNKKCGVWVDRSDESRMPCQIAKIINSRKNRNINSNKYRIAQKIQNFFKKFF